jgi:hypothetical protein
MHESYVIIWAAKAKDRSGIGKKYFTKIVAEALAAELNKTYPDFLHWGIDTAKDEPVKALSALRESLSRVGAKAVPLPEFASQHAAAAELPTVVDPNAPVPVRSKPGEPASLVQAA